MFFTPASGSFRDCFDQIRAVGSNWFAAHPGGVCSMLASFHRLFAVYFDEEKIDREAFNAM